MELYKLYFTITETYEVEIEADNDDAAREIAWAMGSTEIDEKGEATNIERVEFVDFDKVGE